MRHFSSALGLILITTWSLRPPHLRAAEGPPPPPKAQQVHVVFQPRRHCVLSAEVSSRSVATPRRVGDAFAAGDVLIRLDDTAYAANRDKAAARVKSSEVDLALLDDAVPRANLDKAKARLGSMRIIKATKESLFKDNAIGVSEIEEARAAVKVAEADVVIAEAELAARRLERAKAEALLRMAKADLIMTEKQLSACTIKAPFAGRVVKVHVQEHERVQPGQELIEILDDQVLRAQFFLPASHLRHVHVGDMLRIAVRETHAAVEAKVTHISPEINPVTSTLTVFAEVQNPPGAKERITSGMRGLLDLGRLVK